MDLIFKKVVRELSVAYYLHFQSVSSVERRFIDTLDSKIIDSIASPVHSLYEYCIIFLCTKLAALETEFHFISGVSGVLTYIRHFQMPSITRVKVQLLFILHLSNLYRPYLLKLFCASTSH